MGDHCEIEKIFKNVLFRVKLSKFRLGKVRLGKFRDKVRLGC